MRMCTESTVRRVLYGEYGEYCTCTLQESRSTDSGQCLHAPNDSIFMVSCEHTVNNDLLEDQLEDACRFRGCPSERLLECVSSLKFNYSLR